jgi:signal transduction histidine kinase
MGEKSATIYQRTTIELFGVSLFLFILIFSFYNYLIFHSFMEIFTVVIAGGVFMLAWNTREYQENQYLLTLAIAYLFVAVVDTLHMLAYQGMGVFALGGAKLSTQLWIIGRFLQATALLIAPFFINRKLPMFPFISTYALATGFLLLTVFFWRVFPTTFTDIGGLTPFKRVLEGVITSMFVIGAYLVWRKRADFSPVVFRFLFVSFILLVASELCFFSYVTVIDTITRIGHAFRLLSFYFVYKAVLEIGIRQPHEVFYWNLKQSEKVLRAQTIELQAYNTELDAYAHTVAHDLQNPLTAIVLASEALRNPNLPDRDRQEMMNEIGITARKMSHIIESLMLLAEVRSEEAPHERVDIAPLIDNIKLRQAHLIKEKGAEIFLSDHWPPVMGYAPWVEEVLANLVSNAIKYGGPSPRVELGVDPQTDGMLRFWVRDHGPGIEEEKQALLFQPFKVRKHTGLSHGLGLSIAQRIVEKLGGHIGVESHPGDGCTFYFTLPAYDVPEVLQDQAISDLRLAI